MRIGLIAALHRTASGTLRAHLPLAGCSVMAWQAALLRSVGAERVLCLCEEPGDELLELQQELEACGIAFHALRGFSALPALVRAEDDLIVVRDGLVPDPALVRRLLGDQENLQRMVAAIPADHPLAADFPEDFERIDALRHWAGLLVMRGSPVQQLADFPPDADAVSVLLRLALQTGTPCHELAGRELTPQNWLMADSLDTLTSHEQGLIAHAAPARDWRAPLAALAAVLVRWLAPRWLAQGGILGVTLALILLTGAVLMAAFEAPVIALALAGLGAFAAQVAEAYMGLAARLRRETGSARAGAALQAAVDGLAALTLWFVVSPLPQWQPLAAVGPLAVGLARLNSRQADGALGTIASDRAALLVGIGLATAAGLLGEALACLALGLLLALLLRRGGD